MANALRLLVSTTMRVPLAPGQQFEHDPALESDESRTFWSPTEYRGLSGEGREDSKTFVVGHRYNSDLGIVF